MQTVNLNVCESSNIVELSVLDTGGVSLSVENVRNIYIERPEYQGEYTVTPGAVAQILETNGKRMTSNVTVGAIPNNYGLITWNGSVLTVS